MKKGPGRKPKEPIHKASVDDYDKKTQEKEESIVYPLITYDPGLLDLALIIVTLSRTQTIMVLLCAECDVDHAANPLPAAPADGAVGSAHSPSIARAVLRHLTPRGQALLADRGVAPGDDGVARRRQCLLLLAAHTALFGPARAEAKPPAVRRVRRVPAGLSPHRGDLRAETQAAAVALEAVCSPRPPRAACSGIEGHTPAVKPPAYAQGERAVRSLASAVWRREPPAPRHVQRQSPVQPTPLPSHCSRVRYAGSLHR